MKSKQISQLTIPGTPGKVTEVFAFDSFSTFVIQLIRFYSDDLSNTDEKRCD